LENKLLLSEIFIYPVKSLGGISLTESLVEQRGLQYDRRMMLVDENGIFITQRDFPQMALLKTRINNYELAVIHSKFNHSISIPLKYDLTNSSRKIKVIIWNDECTAMHVAKEADDFFSDMIGIKCHLVYMPDDEKRIVDRERKYVKSDHTVSFADGYPFLIIGQSSLDDLNKRLDTPVPVNRFRPNFVFTGGKPFEEDEWKDFMIGEIKFRAVKQCARCIITTTDQNTAERDKEPLRTLSTFRKSGNKVLLGMNLISYNTGKVKVGDNITLL
jgi:uncharacterized protein YcbX